MQFAETAYQSIDPLQFRRAFLSPTSSLPHHQGDLGVDHRRWLFAHAEDGSYRVRRSAALLDSPGIPTPVGDILETEIEETANVM
jgi:hypothetical protein